MSDDAESSRSRRELLRASGVGAAAAAAVLLDACKGADSTRSALHQAPHLVRHADIALLNHALDIENATIAAYTAGIPLLAAGAQRAAKRFLSQDISHAGELSGLIKEAGGTAHQPKSSYKLGAARNAAGVLRLLRALETAQIRAYLDAIPRISPGPVRAAVASILANDAQHATMLRASAGLAPLSSPFVTTRG